HRLRLAEQPFGDASDWLDDLRAMWERKFDAVEQFLTERRDAPATRDDAR
ncbi:MAG: hypothetical protein JWM66_1428, partial [Solirubrobacterales bacterium]|nr:hypothetical protein [Solirubrobacterales bacterium]